LSMRWMAPGPPDVWILVSAMVGKAVWDFVPGTLFSILRYCGLSRPRQRCKQWNQASPSSNRAQIRAWQMCASRGCSKKTTGTVSCPRAGWVSRRRFSSDLRLVRYERWHRNTIDDKTHDHPSIEETVSAYDARACYQDDAPV
jgi:hypothetical protein